MKFRLEFHEDKVEDCEEYPTDLDVRMSFEAETIEELMTNVKIFVRLAGFTDSSFDKWVDSQRIQEGLI